MSITTVREICKFMSEHLPEEVYAIETGIMYTCQEGNEVHTTTNNLLQYASKGKCILHSLDIDKEHIEYAQNFLKDNGISTDYFFPFHGDSVESIRKITSTKRTNGVSILCLDSKEFDEDHMVNEFEEAKGLLLEDHYLLIDDIHNPNSVKYKKLLPLLPDMGYNVVEIKTPTGMAVASKTLPLPDA